MSIRVATLHMIFDKILIQYISLAALGHWLKNGVSYWPTLSTFAKKSFFFFISYMKEMDNKEKNGKKKKTRRKNERND